MAKTLDQLMAECGLASSTSVKEHEKVASAPAKDEIDQVLEGLGLNSLATEEESVEKVASENETTGGNMSLTRIYEEMFGTEEQIEKVASEEVVEQVEQTESRENLFGQLVAHYFNAGQSEYIEKVAAEMDSDQQPLAHASTGGQLTGIIGEARDPHLPVNADASGGKALHVMTGSQSPYSLASAGPAIKAVLKRKLRAEAGEVGAYHQG
jgi:hypothetical protein